MHKLISITFFAVLIITACKPRNESPLNYKGDQLHFGQGGGFSGIITHYALLDNGQLYQKENRDTIYTFVDSWDQAFVRQMFDNYHQLGLNKVEHYHPGNLYYFIEFHSRDEEIRRIAWGQTGYTPDENIVKFYNLLYRSTKSKS